MPKNKAFFLDRDGVVIESDLSIEKKPKPFHDLKKIFYVEGIFDLCDFLIKQNFLIIIITNQPDFSRGIVSKDIIDKINDDILSKLPINKIYTCYHDKHHGCKCRKPNNGNLLNAQIEFDIDFSQSYFIGDRGSDIKAGNSVGCKSIFIDYNYNETKPADCLIINNLRDCIPFLKNELFRHN